MKNSKKKWSNDDIEFLLENYGIRSMGYLIRHLKRTSEAIQQKHRELANVQNMHIAGGMLSPREVADALGVDNRTVMYWIHRKGLNAQQLYKAPGLKKARYRYFLDGRDVWRWVEKYKDLINFSLVKRNKILPEPEWLDEAISSHTYTKRSTNWTKEEDEIAWFLWQSGVNYREIAQRLNRPPKGTQSRLTIIRKRKNESHVKTN